MKDFFPFGLVVELFFLALLIGDVDVLVGGELWKVSQAHRVYVAVCVVEPLVDVEESTEIARRIVVHHIDRGHVTFAFVAAQVEAQVLSNHFIVSNYINLLLIL